MLKELKSELKSLAEQIRIKRTEYKAAQRAGNAGWPEFRSLCYTFRHKHIAYCLLRGRTREQIESFVREDNKANEDYIQELMDGYKNHVAILTGTLERPRQPETPLKRLYVIVDETLPKSYQAAQAGHAIAEFMKSSKEWNNEVLILLKAPYSTIKKYAGNSYCKFVGFSEPDLGNRLTAIAGVQDISSSLVKGLPLL
jgi:hypothetical protein